MPHAVVDGREGNVGVSSDSKSNAPPNWFGDPGREGGTAAIIKDSSRREIIQYKHFAIVDTRLHCPIRDFTVYEHKRQPKGLFIIDRSPHN